MRITALSAALFGLGALVSAQLDDSEIEDRVHTTVAIDAPAAHQALDRGQVFIHITRFDDLVTSGSGSDEAQSEGEHRLLMEKQTHLMLRLALDLRTGQLDVNGNGIDLAAPQLTVVKAEALAIPAELVDSPQTVEELKQHMTGSLVSAQVGVTSELINGDLVSLRSAHSDEWDAEVVEAQVDDAQLRRINVDLQLLEIDGHSIAHLSNLRTSILQFLISRRTSTGEILSVQTLPSPSSSLPSIAPPFAPLPDAQRPTSFLDSLRAFFGLPPRPPRRGCHRPRPVGIQSLSDFDGEMPESAIAGAMAPHADVPSPPLAMPFKDEDGTTNLITHRVGFPGGRLFHDDMGRPQPHGHMHVLTCALRIVFGVLLGIVLIPIMVLMNPVVAVVAICAFIVVRRTKKARRDRLARAAAAAAEGLEEGGVRLDEGEEKQEQEKGEKEGLLDLEEVVVVDELPKYEEKA